MHARHYRPGLGRFLSVDPRPTRRTRVPQTWNRYSYAASNPLKYFDPDGRDLEIAIAFNAPIARPRQEVIARNIGQAFITAGVKNVTVKIGADKVFASPFDRTAHEKGRSKQTDLQVDATNKMVDSQERHGFTPAGEGRSIVSLTRAPQGSPALENFTINVGTHELGHQIGAFVLQWDYAPQRDPDSVQQTALPADYLGSLLLNFSEEDAALLRMFLNGETADDSGSKDPKK